MSLIREIPPTAGWPIKTKSLVPHLFKRLSKGLLEEDFKKYLNAPSALLTCSGTAAFYLILESIKKISGKKTVIIPAFVCPLIPLAIKRAGLKIRPCDINQDNFDFNINKLRKICAEDNDILAILAVHLAGIPLDLEPIQKIAKENNIFIIEDCAQSLGAEYRDKKTGSIGEFSFFSLCRGKGLTIYEGGLAITNQSEYARILENTAKEIMHADILSETLKIAELFAYSIFYRPALFWFAFRLPQIFWQICNNPVKAMGEYFEINFPVHKISSFRGYIGHLDFPRLSKEIDKQREQAAFYLKALKDLPGVKPIAELPHTKASYPYLSIIFETPERRNSALGIFKDSGLGVSQVYLRAIADYDYLKGIIPEADCEQARRIAQQTITLSTSSFLGKPELRKIIDRLKKHQGKIW
ncbi:MAG: aminotransferase class V-fold PLP-dependent enzyme [Candidatus Omnitrophica bacterium]|nr:aminotransferase class V-fold PLP-dependent enzyme [Candidatus Omnitrophota bacterium]